MNHTVSVSDFRNNLNEYLELAIAGSTVVVKDAKKDKSLVKVIKADQDEFDWGEHLKWIMNFKPVLTDEDIEDYKKLRKSFDLRSKRNNW